MLYWVSDRCWMTPSRMLPVHKCVGFPLPLFPFHLGYVQSGLSDMHVTVMLTLTSNLQFIDESVFLSFYEITKTQ